MFIDLNNVFADYVYAKNLGVHRPFMSCLVSSDDNINSYQCHSEKDGCYTPKYIYNTPSEHQNIIRVCIQFEELHPLTFMVAHITLAL